MAQFPRETVRTGENAVFNHDTTAKASADDGGNGSRFVLPAEENVMAPNCAGVAIIYISDGIAEFHGEERRGRRSQTTRSERNWLSRCC